MSHYESLVDPAEFGLIADYLVSTRSPIRYLVHVRSREALAPLAEALHSPAAADQPPWLFPEVVERGIAEGSLRLSARDLSFNSDRVIDPRTVPRHATCHVIYSPPFYLVHTPGLFEGTLIRPQQQVKTTQRRANNRRSHHKL